MPKCKILVHIKCKSLILLDYRNNIFKKESLYSNPLCIIIKNIVQYLSLPQILSFASFKCKMKHLMNSNYFVKQKQKIYKYEMNNKIMITMSRCHGIGYNITRFYTMV